MCMNDDKNENVSTISPMMSDGGKYVVMLAINRVF